MRAHIHIYVTRLVSSDIVLYKSVGPRMNKSILFNAFERLHLFTERNIYTSLEAAKSIITREQKPRASSLFLRKLKCTHA